MAISFSLYYKTITCYSFVIINSSKIYLHIIFLVYYTNINKFTILYIDQSLYNSRKKIKPNKKLAYFKKIKIESGGVTPTRFNWVHKYQ